MSQSRNRARYVAAVLVLAALTLVTLSARGGGNSTLRSVRSDAHGALSSVDNAIHDALRPVGNFLTGAVDYGSLKSDNASLRRQLAAERAAGEQAQFEKAEYEQLLTLEHIPFAAGIQTVAAQVVDQSASNFESTITIDKGSAAGVAVGQPVVTAAGLAGSVSSVTGSSAVVTLLTDPDFAVGVALPSGDVGSATGEGTATGLSVGLLPTTSSTIPAPARGQVLYTSAIGGHYPAGIPVGRVSTVTRAAGQGEPAITLAPSVDTRDIGFVDVMLWSGQ